MPQVQVRRSGIEPRFDSQRSAGREPFPQIGLDQQVICAATNDLDLSVYSRHTVTNFIMWERALF